MQTAIPTHRPGIAVKSISRKHVSVVKAASQTDAATSPASVTSADPLLLRALRGEQVERPPVWLMRQVRTYPKT